MYASANLALLPILTINPPNSNPADHGIGKGTYQLLDNFNLWESFQKTDPTPLKIGVHMTEGEKRQLRKDFKYLELRINAVDKNISTKMVEAYSKSQKYTDLLEEKVKNQQEVLETLISWLAYDLGPQNSITLLNQLNKGK